MLVLERREGETIQIGDNVFVTITSIRGRRVRVGITAPKEVKVNRTEVIDRQTEHHRRLVLGERGR